MTNNTNEIIFNCQRRFATNRNRKKRNCENTQILAFYFYVPQAQESNAGTGKAKDTADAQRKKLYSRLDLTLLANAMFS